MTLIKESCFIEGKELIIETGHMANRSSGSVTVKYGKSVILATVNADFDIDNGAFLPLNVDFVENFYASGKIPGSFYRREGKPSVSAILNARIIDRAIRPLFPEDLNANIHLVINVLSYEKESNQVMLGMLAASCALSISDIPFNGPLGAVTVGVNDKGYCIGCGKETSITVASTEENIIMIEANSNETSEKAIIDGVYYGKDHIGKIIELQKKFIEKNSSLKKQIIKNTVLNDEQRELVIKLVKEHLSSEDNTSLKKKVLKAISLELGEDYSLLSKDISKLVRETIRSYIVKNNKRVDGRAFDEIRNIDIDLNLLPEVHGSALFTRGLTQSLGTVTLGGADDQQIIDDLNTEYKKNLFLHYNFPPFSVGEPGFLRAPARREIGHGSLAEKALYPVVPQEDFPYTIRIVSDILSSNGSSSMASVCSASLSLMAAGVPIKRAVAGVAMGLIQSEDRNIILTDITGLEDSIGDMDFKVAGTAEGITALQMDIKAEGISREILTFALEEAKKARLNILDVMNNKIAKPREEMLESVPRYSLMRIDPSKISSVIGAGGKTIKSIIEQTGAELNIEDGGKINIFAKNFELLEKTKSLINSIIKDIEVGDEFKEAKVKKVIQSGAFISLTKDKEGFLHISEVSNQRIKDINSFIKENDRLDVKVISIDREKNRLRVGLLKKFN